MKLYKPCPILGQLVFMLLLSILPSAVGLARDLPREPLPRFDWPASSLTLDCRPEPDTFLEALGEEAGLWGNAITGLEAWVYPFKLASSITLEYGDGEQTGDRHRQVYQQVSMPHLSQVRLKGEHFSATETFFVPRSKPGMAILLDVDPSVDMRAELHLKPSLAPMLLDAGKTLTSRFDWRSQQLVVTEKQRQVELRIWSPAFTGHTSHPAGGEELTIDLSVATARKGRIPICMAISWPDGPSAQRTLSELASGLPTLVERSAAHYRSLLDEVPFVQSPDSVVNTALAWSTISLHQLRVVNPFLGSGLVSGYSPSGDTTRPKYAWFFDEPTLTSWAYLRAGLQSHVRDAFNMLLRYQRQDGKMVHEITQSLPYHADYFNAYQWAYIHSSSGTYLMAAFGNYLRNTGDIAFVRRHWPALCKMLEWCLAAIDPDDGILQVAPKDWGSSESSFEVRKDTQMAGMWIVALREMEYLAGAMDDHALAERCRLAARKASESLERQFWNDDESNYLWGLDRAGRPLKSSIPHHSVCGWLGALRDDRVRRMLERMAASDFRTDWGVRSLASSTDRYDPKGYQTGTVWPVWNAGVIICDYRCGRQVDAFRNFRSMCSLRTTQALGPMAEVLRGDVFARLSTGVPHQMFSETAIQNGFYDGLLGLTIAENQIQLSPRLPASWTTLSVARMPVPDGTIDLQIRRTEGAYELKWHMHSDASLPLMLSPMLPAGCEVTGIVLDNAVSQGKDNAGRDHSSLLVRNPVGSHTVAFHYRGGRDFEIEDQPLVKGQASRNMRLISAVFSDDTWRLKVEGLPGRIYPLLFYTGERPTHVRGGAIIRGTKRPIRVDLESPDDATQTSTDYVRWDAEVGWQ